MNKMKKLLSVVLAVVLAFSALTVLGSAARTSYKTVDELKALDAYSPYGQVTRLSTEERMSIILDSLDMLLAPMTSLNMGTLVDTMGLTVRINLTSVDNICDSLDSFHDTMNSATWSIASAIVNLGVLEDLDFDSWATGMTRDGTAQLTIIRELLELLNKNAGTIANIVKTGDLDLGLVSSLANINIDLSIIADIPGLIKGLVFPLLERWDDTLTEIQTLDTNSTGDGNVESTVNTYVKGLFNNDMSITTIKYDVNGTMTSEHTGWLNNTGSAAPAAPTANSPRYYYQFSSTTPGSVMTVYHIVDAKEAEDSDVAAYSYVAEELTYTLTEEAGNGVYVWKATDDWGNEKTLKWYNDDSNWLDGISGNDIDLTTMSLADLLYKFVPPVFEAMAPVVLNGSVKKILAEFLGAKFNYVGDVGSDAVNALADASNAFFTEEQGEYLWEWSNYIVIGENHYYRFEDQIFVADLSQKNNYFDIIDWDYEIGGDFLDEFLPTADGGTPSPDNTLLMNLNDFIVKVAKTALKESAETKDSISEYEATWTRPALTEGDNSNLVANIKVLAQTIIGLAPQHVFGDDWNDEDNQRCYVSLMLANYSNGTVAGVTCDESVENDVILTGIAAHIVNLVMPSMSLPGKDAIIASNAKVGAILAAVIREFAAYLAPEYNYDALIYADYGTTTVDKEKTFVDPEAAGLLSSGQTASGYWLDVCLTMGMDVGYEYLRAFADLGEDSSEVISGVVDQGYGAAGKVYTAGTTQAQLNAQWEALLDYIVDWALEKDYEWTWKMENLVNTDGLTIDLATAQDPWVKLDHILNNLLPADEILNVTATDCETELEQLLRYNLILAIVDLRWEDLADMLKVPNGFVRNANVLDSLATVLKNLVNGLFAKVGNTSGNYEFIPSVITDFDSLANQSNLATLVEGLLTALVTAQDRGLLDTVLPIVNFFLGWKMDPQAYADPVIYYENPSYLPYIYVSDGSTVSTTLKVANNASGMLETHRNSDVVDAPYVLTIKSVTCDDSNINATTSLPVTVQPYATADIAISGTYTSDKVVRFTVVYTFTGKDGQPIGGEQTMQTYMYVSNKTDYNYQVAAHTDGWQCKTSFVGTKADAVRVQREAFNAVKYGASVKDIVENFTITFTNNSAEDYSEWVYSNTGSGQPSYVTANQSWVHGCNENETLKANHQGWMNNGEDVTSNTVNPLTWVADTDTSEMTSGWVSANLGSLATVWHNHKSDGNFGMGSSGDVKVTINTSDLGEIRIVDTSALAAKADSYASVMESDFDLTTTEAQNAWAAFDTALRNAYTTAKMPYHMSDAAEFTATFNLDAQQALADALDEAYDALKVFADAGANADEDIPSYVQALEAALALDDGDGENEVNFQDYEFYEYFNYADLRTAHRNFIKTYYAPDVMDTYYILNSGIREAELDKVIAAEDNAYIAAGITASRLENDPAAVAASVSARAEWKMPVNSKLLVEDMTARLLYYKQFLIKEADVDNDNDGTETTAHLYFLKQEIAHIDAQELQEEDYTAASWANFQEEYADAQAVVAGTAEYSDFNSVIYEAKWNLMVAYKNLLLTSRSLNLNNDATEGTEDGDCYKILEDNILEANNIFATYADGAYVLAADYTGTEEEAFAQLISALGYYYTGEDGVEYNLYADSALEYYDNDRPNNQNNMAKLNTSNAALEAAIANFEAAEEEMEPSTLMVEEGFEYADYVVIDTNNTNNGEYTGIVYGIDTLDQNDMVEVLGSLNDALTTNNGDDYLVITENDSGIESTGALIEVVDENGDVLETYVFVYFGDVDGDGTISSNDAYLAGYYEFAWEGLNSYAEYVSCDIDGDGSPSSNDAYIMGYYEFAWEGVDYQYNLGQNAVANTYEWF